MNKLKGNVQRGKKNLELAVRCCSATAFLLLRLQKALAMLGSLCDTLSNRTIKDTISGTRKKNKNKKLTENRERNIHEVSLKAILLSRK